VVAAFVEPFALASGMVTCHASVGVVATGDADDGAQLLSRADIALAMAKSGGKARWCRYEATLHTRVLERLQLRAALDQAISNGEFVLAYQPVVDLATGSTHGFEALVRWHHPTRGLVPPLDFIEIAEESGLIVQLGEWILKTAINTAADWRRCRPNNPLYITVNVSPRQFRSEGFTDLVFYELATSGLPPNLLILEITENLLLSDRDHERVWQELNALREIGVRIAIDDFGTGFSSLSYLHKVPVDIVKLDKSFVDTITTSAPQFELVKGIVQLAGTLHLTVVAEGVETDADRRMLIEAGCQYGQGFLFARPMYDEDARDWLRSHVPAARIPNAKPTSA
jgi:EAL domain-containing protein (putative c-di-GMP-specific phosphodiesterase class I)